MSLRDDQPYPSAPPEVVTAMNGNAPTVQQWRAISHPLTPCSVVAGAGSGKTAVMAARVVYLALVRRGLLVAEHAGALPSEVLCLTFTNKAAEELSRRVRVATERLGLPEGEEATVFTYHAFAAGLLDDHGLRAGLEPGQALLSGAQKWQIIERLFADRELEHMEVRSLRYGIPQVLQLADQCANHLVDPERVIRHSVELAARQEVRTAIDRDMLQTAQKRAELAELALAYQARKRELSAIDYGDQIAKAHGLVRDHPEVVEAFRARFPVVLLDEYQDTNVAQARLLAALLGPDYPVFAVGDPDQNIYAWRGATLANVLRFADEFSSGEAEQRPLEVNFRSGSRILAAANAVIGAVPPERRGADKVLRPDPSRQDEGRVTAFVATDERSEARQIAGLLRSEVDLRRGDGDPRWDECVVLCRKKKLFEPIAEVLREEGIPVEVVDLGGLLTMPEVVDVLAWLHLLADPADNVSLARILMGPRWRLGYRDIAALARWSMWRNAGMDLEDDPSPGDVRFALSEALEHLDDPEMQGLTDEARVRLGEVRAELAALRERASAPLGDLVGEVIERSGLMRELEASGEPAAVSARRNLLNLVDHVSAFSPVEGQASLASLMDYLLAAAETEDELEPAQVSDANTVKLMTIHKAKGLEWPVVFVPGLAEHDRSGSSFFPDVSRQPNPVTQAATLPFDVRGDAADLPQYAGNIKAFRAELTDRGLEEERRLCYVALTRAKDLLVVSAAHWYGDVKEPHGPGRFLEEVAAVPGCETLFRADPPEESPLVAHRRDRATGWPPQRGADADELFPMGWHEAAVMAAEQPAWVDALVREHSPAEQAEFRRLVEADLERVARIEQRTAAEPALPLPKTLSVSSVIDYLRCPKLFYWSYVRPLPRRAGEAARLGTEVHRWIELQARGQATLIDPEDLVDLATEERMAEAAPAAKLREAFKRSRFAGQVPLYTERPFLLYLDGFVVGGRIDAIFGRADGAWEIVDYKTGRVPPEGDVLSGLQLDLYALAAQEIWGKSPEEVTLTYAYLAEEKEVTRQAGEPDETRKRVVAALGEMAEGRFDAVPGFQCRWCDFLTFCEPGRAWVASTP